MLIKYNPTKGVPIAMLKNPDGTLTENAAIVFGSFISDNNYSNINEQLIRNTSCFYATFLKNKLHVNGDFTFAYTDSVESRLYTPVPYSKAPDIILQRGESKMNESNGKTTYTGANLYADYEEHLGQHYFKILLGYNYEHQLFKARYYQRNGLINSSLPDFSLLNGLNYTLTGGGNEWRTLGSFFRLNYNYKERYSFGFTGGANWNNFFVNFFFQGVGKRQWWPGTDASLFWGQYNRPYSWMPTAILNNRWSEQHPDAYFPRFRGYTALNSNAELTVLQSKYVQNVAYIRLKNITVGYNVPSAWASRVHMKNARIFFTGQNLWTWSPIYRLMRTMDPEVIEGADPELSPGAGNGMSYPMLKSYTVGINVTF
ncbi:hypothetical protein ACDQ55_01215 [Chitinophaga sp. 30R24]|uniref:hypothetical protein n=1 Tax=Chitinophaga sp. 30R24 TaxID=3248838 RepID=UPI003B901CB7